MTRHPSAKVQEAGEIIGTHLNAILALFKPGRKVMLIVWAPDEPDGGTDLAMGSGTAQDAIERLKLRIDPNVMTQIGDVVVQ